MLIALDPRVYMFDEPTAGMSVDEVPVVLDLIRALKAQRDKTILLVEHKMDVVRELADRDIIRIEDPYAWLRDKGYPKVDDADVLAYLKAENAYYEAAMKPHQALTDALFEEMKGRIKEDDSSVPQKDGDYIYWSKFDEGAQYRKHYRKPVKGGADQLILDENKLAEGKEYFRLGGVAGHGLSRTDRPGRRPSLPADRPRPRHPALHPARP